jgi:hypothetical protein
MGIGDGKRGQKRSGLELSSQVGVGAARHERRVEAARGQASGARERERKKGTASRPGDEVQTENNLATIATPPPSPIGAIGAPRIFRQARLNQEAAMGGRCAAQGQLP